MSSATPSGIPASFTPGASATGPEGQRAHPLAIEQAQRLQRKFFNIENSAWFLVGNGLSNQGFVKGPKGIIAIDTGESIEEMREAIAELRQHTAEPIVACIYTHFHYVSGTQAILDENGKDELPIYGHERIEHNLRRFGGEVAPRSSRGLVHQFGIMLPADGEDGLLSCGLGRFFRNPEHAPFSNGYIPANKTFADTLDTEIAGLKVHMFHAPSDADDSITLWFPELSLCVNNLIWPALFNVFAIRGEEYRDPRILLHGIDQIIALDAAHLACTHGPPISGAAQIRSEATRYRDSIQFLWDQTVRGANLGLSLDELVTSVSLPASYQESYFTQQLYGVAEHHIRQIYNGLFGWFDEDPAKLFALPPQEKARRMIAGFGGHAAVREQLDGTLAMMDYRWALELGGWLTRAPDADHALASEDRQRMASVLQGIAHTTTSANIRNWCLTSAGALSGQLDLTRFRGHRFSAGEVAAKPVSETLPLLRVLLDPERAGNRNETLQWIIDGEQHIKLQIRGGIALVNENAIASFSLALSHAQFAALLGRKASLSDLLQNGQIETDDASGVCDFLACFDLDAFR